MFWWALALELGSWKRKRGADEMRLGAIFLFLFLFWFPGFLSVRGCLGETKCSGKMVVDVR